MSVYLFAEITFSPIVTQALNRNDFLTVSRLSANLIIMKNHILQKLQECLSRFPDVRLAFLFGSFAGGYASATSDIDIALLFEKKPDYYILETI